jgi:hypothetical protein
MVRIFRYHPGVDAFALTAEYAALAEVLGMEGWESFAWIGRLFTLDNDVGEHWFDNWALREQRAEVAARHGLDADTLLFIDPRRMADGRDGPCNTDEFRTRFWTEVLSSLDLSEELIITKAREFHARCAEPSEMAALEARIVAWRQDRGDARE